MKFRVALLLLVILSAFVARTNAQPTDTSVEAASRRFIVAFNNLDMPAFLDRFADDATLIHPQSGPPRTFPKRVQGKAEIQRTFQVVFDLIKGGRTTPPYQDLQPRDLLIQEYRRRCRGEFSPRKRHARRPANAGVSSNGSGLEDRSSPRVDVRGFTAVGNDP